MPAVDRAAPARAGRTAPARLRSSRGSPAPRRASSRGCAVDALTQLGIRVAHRIDHRLRRRARASAPCGRAATRGAPRDAGCGAARSRAPRSTGRRRRRAGTPPRARDRRARGTTPDRTAFGTTSCRHATANPHAGSRLVALASPVSNAHALLDGRRAAARTGRCDSCIVTPCVIAEMRSSPAPVSTDGFGSGTIVPSGCRSNCMNTRFQNSRKRSRLRAFDERVERELLAIELGPLAGRAVGKAPIARDVREVDEDLRARTARAGVRHLPEVVLVAESVDARVRQVRRSRATARAPRRRSGAPTRAAACGSSSELLGDELPREANRVALEVVAEREVAEHLEERVCRAVWPTCSRSLCLPPARTHFCDVVARRFPSGGSSMPRKTFLNCTMPALVNSSVGSSPGTSDELGRTAWPLRAKYWRKRDRISEASILGIYRSFRRLRRATTRRRLSRSDDSQARGAIVVGCRSRAARETRTDAGASRAAASSR